MKSFFEKLKQNRGSGMVIVILAIIFLTAFGTLAMTMSYTSFEMSVAERQGKEAGYNAESAMEQVRCGIQTAASEAMSKTYNKILRDYTYNAGNIKDEFITSFLQFFRDYKVGESDVRLVIDSGSGTLIYNPSTLEDMIEEERGGKAVVNGTGAGIITYNSVTHTYTFKDIRIDYTSPNGRVSSVTADIDVRIPDIGYILTQYALSGIPEHCLIVRGTLFQNKADNKRIQLRGDAYCGNVELSGFSEFIVSNNMTFVIGDTLKVSLAQADKPRFNQYANTTMWAKNIEIGSSTNVEFNGKTYVRNDLRIQGSNSRVRISGQYVGFGTGYENPQTANPTDPKLAAYSSSIIVNGMGNVLDLAGSSLTLGGVSFIGNQFEGEDGLTSENAVPMGESISVKSNQRAFLVPEGQVERYMYTKGVDETGVPYFEAKITLASSSVYDGARVYYNEATGTYSFKIANTEGIWGSVTEKVIKVEPTLIGPVPVTNSIEILTEDEFNDLALYKIKGENWDFIFEDGSYKWHCADSSNVAVKSLNKTYSDYTIKLKQVQYPAVGHGYVVIYLFMDFENDDKRSEFFEDYFIANPAVINNYVKKHIDNSAYSRQDKPSYIPPNSLDSVGIAMGMPDFETSSSGVFEWGLPNNPYPLEEKPSYTGNFYMNKGVTSTITTMCDFILTVFETFKRTLSNVEDDTVADDINPYDYYVREDLILGNESEGIPGLFPSQEEGEMFFYVGNESTPRGLVVKGDLDYSTVDSSYRDLRIMIVTGNAYINSNYSGLIFVGGDLYVNESVIFKRDASGVSNTFEADSLEGKDSIGPYKVKNFLKGDILTQYVEEESASGEAWNIEKLVHYSKWKKN